MGHNSYKQENLVRVAEFFRDSNGRTIPTQEITDTFGIPKDQRLAIFRCLQRRNYILKMGSSNSKTGEFAGIYYQQNPNFQGVFADVLINFKDKVSINPREIAGRAYVPPPNKEPWEPEYFKDLMKHKNLCESTRYLLTR